MPMPRLDHLIPDPSQRHALTLDAALTDFLPFLLCYYATAVLALLPNTFYIRVALLPISLWNAFRIATTLDLAAGCEEPERHRHLNFGLCIAMFAGAMRLIDWTFSQKPLERRTKHASEPADEDDASRSITRALWEGLDLASNLRGLGWEWSSGLRIPRETRPTHSTTAFALATFYSMLRHWIMADLIQFYIQYTYPDSIGSAHGGSIVDHSLPPLARYAQSTFLTFIAGFCIYGAMQATYDLFTLVGIFVFGQAPSQWPLLFDAPYLSTSLTEFWATRWHQTFRRLFIRLGAQPLSLLAGRVGGVLGAFLLSGLMHDAGMWGMGFGTELSHVTGAFLMMGVGIMLEQGWKKITGVRVAGVAGWIWTFGWLVFWCHFMVDAWTRRGLVGCKLAPDISRPSALFLALGHWLGIGFI
ncbi:hypothetical protein PLICRDRAFT_91011 [Plicaturopsis crispa FD-325 SS-3]|nr:hypothetical protein PLICRDRAFT_91011 [Plicaturopsis crispa FD-325 SS-3]